MESDLVSLVGFDIKSGGDLHGIDIPPDEHRSFIAAWANGAWVEIMHYDEPPLPERPGDCIKMVVHAHDGVPHGWYLSPEDVDALMFGLGIAIDDHRLGHK